MASIFRRIPFRESRGLVIVCAVIFGMLLAARILIPAPVRAERLIEKRKAAGQDIRPESYVPVWLHKGLRCNLWISGALLLASPWLGSRKPRQREAGMNQPFSRWTRWQLAGCAGVIALAAWHNTPRLFQSMWGDEEFNASRFIIDEAVRKADGGLEIRQRPWQTTLWNCRKTTNHMGYSAVARLSHSMFFKKRDGPNDPWFSEAILRLPVFVAGLALIPAWLWAMKAWGLNGWWSLGFLVLHPWFARFGVDGRAYGLMMLLGTIMLGAIGEGMRRGGWFWWGLFAFCESYLLWCNAQSLYLCAAANLTIGLALIALRARGSEPWPIASRWLAANIFALMLVVGMLAPCWPQLREFMATHPISGSLDARWWRDSLCGWTFGQPWSAAGSSANPLLHAMTLSMKNAGFIHWLGIVAVSAWLGSGLVLMARSPKLRPLLAWSLGAPVLMLVHMGLSHTRPYDWYLVPFLPGILIAASALGDAMTRAGWRGRGLLVLAPTLAFFAYLTHRPRQLFRQHPTEPARESVASYRPVTNPRHPDIEKHVISGGFSMFTEGYDPCLHRFEDVAGLEALMAHADRTGRELFINAGFIDFLRSAPGTAAIVAILDDPNRFEHPRTFYGLLPSTTREVYRYRGKRAAP
ncbi:MAG: hypothetical protein ACR2OZ_01255 [Verrucomicrobiales bacterium]